MSRIFLLFLVLTSNCYADFEWYETPKELRTQPESPPQLLNPLDIERIYATDEYPASDVRGHNTSRDNRLPKQQRVGKPTK